MASTSKASVAEPLEENRTRLCEEFAAIAGTDSAVAQCYLAENEWEMEVQTSSADQHQLWQLSWQFRGASLTSQPLLNCLSSFSESSELFLRSGHGEVI